MKFIPMKIQLEKWGDSLGCRIPQEVAKRLGLNESCIIKLIEEKDSLVITKKQEAATLEGLLDSIPENFEYSTNDIEFIESKPVNREII